MVFAKELWSAYTGGNIPQDLVTVGLIVLPFGLGILRSEPRGAAKTPVGALIQFFVSLGFLAIFCALQWIQGTLPVFASVLGVAVVVYVFGRVIGWSLSRIWKIVILLLLVLLAWRVFADFVAPLMAD